MEIQVTIPIEPMGKPRMTQRDKWAKRPAVQRYWLFKDSLKAAFAMYDLTDIHSVSIKAFFSIPKSWSKIKKQALSGEHHQEKPDIDNVLKACMDSLFVNDAKIYYVKASKYWEDSMGPRIEVELY